MGLLTDDGDAPVPQGEGQRFIDVYRSLDDDDRAMVRAWVEGDRPATYVRDKLSGVGFHVGVSTARKGIARLKAASWEC